MGEKHILSCLRCTHSNVLFVVAANLLCDNELVYADKIHHSNPLGTYPSTIGYDFYTQYLIELFEQSPPPLPFPKPLPFMGIELNREKKEKTMKRNRRSNLLQRVFHI